MKQKQQPLPPIKTIALVAHDGKKQALVDWCQRHKSVLEVHNLYGTGTTGLRIEKETGLGVTKLLSGPMGGDQQLGAKIAEHYIHMLIFFGIRFHLSPMIPMLKRYCA